MQHRRLPPSAGLCPSRPILAFAARAAGAPRPLSAPIAVELLRLLGSRRLGMAKQPPKSLSNKGLRPLAASRTILSVPVLVVPKERAACQFAVLARPLGPDATAGNPGKGKTLN